MKKQSAKNSGASPNIQNGNPTDNENMDIMNTPIRVSDAATMMRRPIAPNERPYTRTVLKSNNRLVDEWEETVLKKICSSNGTVISGQVFSEWYYFYTGKTIKGFIESLNNGLIARPSEEAVTKWVDIFTTYNVKKLTDLGQPLVGYGWKLIRDETFIRDQLLKWENIYSKTEDPLQWRKLANNFPKLWNMDGESPFWGPDDYVDINEKVMTFLSISIRPSQM